MPKISKILVLIDPNGENQDALDKAEFLAHATEARLELVGIYYSSYFEDGHYFDPIQASELREQVLTAHKLELENIAAGVREQGLDAEAVVRWGHPSYKELNELITNANSTLIIKATKHHNKLVRLVLTNEDWDLIRNCSVPLLLVKGRPWSKNPVFLTAVDPEHVNDKPASLDTKMIAYAESLTQEVGGAVHLFHSDWIPPFMGVYSLTVDEGERREKLLEFARKSEIDTSYCHWSDSPLEKSLPDAVEEVDASVVVMGAISRSRLDQVIIGSSAERILDLVDRDVLIVRP